MLIFFRCKQIRPHAVTITSRSCSGYSRVLCCFRARGRRAGGGVRGNNADRPHRRFFAGEHFDEGAPRIASAGRTRAVLPHGLFMPSSQSFAGILLFVAIVERELGWSALPRIEP